ncbi:G:T/U mismatch-specific DNA glycosylase [Bordetella ansorpii]|uniref:G:T/U mismatch-specific DNA glycosylase n=2 Tax=Bordetella ansorpii TaxID=288768 RepID=A0A157SM08_9BORD|nr:G:T/U mismatch-specific DNA glycosylase [Bordetella ansorpii]
MRHNAAMTESASPHYVLGFPPAAHPGARVLVLGTMPGVASLAAVRYYAHPRNAFWPISATLLGFDLALPYEARIQALNDAGVALWDVLAACERPGSLDAAIDSQSAQANDFAGFLAAHPHIRRICFNGGSAQALFRRHVLPALSQSHPDMAYAALPSTSPAHAAMPFAAKLQAWRPIVPD